MAAADANERLLEEVGYDLTKLIEKHAATTLGYGSEFRTVSELKPLIGTHPNFGALSLVLTSGMPYVFNRELDQATKLTELKTLLERGNHKSAKDLPDKVGELLAKTYCTVSLYRYPRGQCTKYPTRPYNRWA